MKFEDYLCKLIPNFVNTFMADDDSKTMALIRHAFFFGLCFFVLLMVRSNIKNKLAFDEIYSAINESHFSPSSVTVKAAKSSTAQIIEINRTYPISLSSSNLRLHSRPLCSREEIRYGTWESVILDAPPYLPRTVHLQCYPESEYKTGQWMHTYEWLPTASSRGNCAFSDWNRDEFCRLMRRATILVGVQYNLHFSCFFSDTKRLQFLIIFWIE